MMDNNYLSGENSNTTELGCSFSAFRVFSMLVLLILSQLELFSQGEALTPMRMNPVVAQKWKEISSQASNTQNSRLLSDTSSIPLNPVYGFFDDFTKESVYPDTAKWIDKAVYINRTMAIAPTSIGVATFDGLDSTGYPYNFAALPTEAAISDYLTSRRINLAYPAYDSIYFSFTYQGQGKALGLGPLQNDSLVLEFKEPGTGNWDWIWSTQGYPSGVVPTNDTNFHPVIIPVIDSVFLKSGFQFRFSNYSCLCGALDQWNVDYVYLNTFRNSSDTIIPDAAFVYNPSSLLKKYQAMPWEQFKYSEQIDTISNFIRYNDVKKSLGANITMHYKVLNAKGDSLNIGSTTTSAVTILSYDSIGYYKGPVKEFARFFLKDSVVPVMTDSQQFVEQYCFTTSTSDFTADNDTARFYQKFYNYYAYDDGTAEQAYYLIGSTPELAIRTHLNYEDTLAALAIFFNPVLAPANLYGFRMAVWNDNKGVPGSVIYLDSTINFPEYWRSGDNQFSIYKLHQGPLTLDSGTYYFGLIQDIIDDGADQLFLGFDMNTNSMQNTYINVSGVWEQSTQKGTVMLRPEFRGWNGVLGIPEQKKSVISFEAFPNPAQNTLNLNVTRTDKTGNLTISMIDMYGRTLWTDKNFTGSAIDISNLPSALYLVKVTDSNFNSSSKRVVVDR
jgi:hypothetical protein